jgi:hypothetical protein
MASPSHAASLSPPKHIGIEAAVAGEVSISNNPTWRLRKKEGKVQACSSSVRLAIQAFEEKATKEV